jgi:hypothetical protein
MAAISKPIEAVMAAGHRRQSANATIVSSPQILVVGRARACCALTTTRRSQPLFVFRAGLAGRADGII